MTLPFLYHFFTADDFYTFFRVNRVNPDVIEERVRSSAHRATDHEISAERRRLGGSVEHTEKVAAGRLAGCGYLIADPADSLLRNAVKVNLPIPVPAILLSGRNPKLPIAMPLSKVRPGGRINNRVEITDVAAF